MLGGHQGHVGGVERQTTLTARWLAARGYEVSLLVYNEGQPIDMTVEGVRVISMCKVSDGIPGLRFIHPRTTSLFSAMKRANADVYYHNLAEYFTGWAALWCRLHGRKFVYSTAHDFDCTASLPALPKLYERLLYRYGIRHADRMIVQTRFQRDLLQQSFGLDSVALPMPCPGPLPASYVPPVFPESPRVVWVGRAVPDKRPDWILDIAVQLPEVRFELAAGNVSGSDYVASVIKRAQSLPNVRWLGSVNREDMPKIYQNSLCLCSTSIHEGFPNTFLESWSHGTPLITTFDPDGLVAANNMGIKVSNPNEAAEGIRAMLKSPERWRTMSKNARSYYENNHLVDSAIARFEQEFLSVFTPKPRSASTQSSSSAQAMNVSEPAK